MIMDMCSEFIEKEDFKKFLQEKDEDWFDIEYTHIFYIWKDGKWFYSKLDEPLQLL